MHEKRLVLALCEVNHTHEECERLERRSWRRRSVDDRTAEVDERVDEEGSEVFDDEDGSPGDLRALMDLSAM